MSKVVRLTRSERRQLQRDMNHFCDVRLEGFVPVKVDGKIGPASQHRIRLIKYYEGMVKAKRNDRVTQEFLDRLRHPKSRKVYGARGLALAIARRAEQRARWRREQRKLKQWRKLKGFAEWENHTVPAWMVVWLDKSRAKSKAWGITSGVRTPEYSRYLCRIMCGHDTCPGRCAGIFSNHNLRATEGFPKGAVDVWGYVLFNKIQREIDSPLINRLGWKDPVHFSPSGR